MRTVLLRLEGPLQSWGTQGRFGIRDTETEPTKSGVLGLVGAAMGMPRDDEATLARLAGLWMGVRVDREGSQLSDYHTVGAGTFRGQPHSIGGTKQPALTQRLYLCDASFLVALCSTEDPTLVEQIAEAVRAPVWPMFLGRRSCVPSAPIFSAVVNASGEEVLRAAPIAARPGTERLRLVLEDVEGVPKFDHPTSFRLHHRRHARRNVRTDWLVLPSPNSPEIDP